MFFLFLWSEQKASVVDMIDDFLHVAILLCTHSLPELEIWNAPMSLDLI